MSEWVDSPAHGATTSLLLSQNGLPHCVYTSHALTNLEYGYLVVYMIGVSGE